MQEHYPPYLRTIHSLWYAGQALEAGMAIYERIPRHLRPNWGADSLEFALACAPISLPSEQQAVIAAVLQFARTPPATAHRDGPYARAAHQIFDDLRTQTLGLNYAQTHVEQLHWLAENVAKLSYNAYGYTAPFDHAAGWLVTEVLHELSDALSDPRVSQEALNVLTQSHYLQLRHPIRCHHACPTCRWLATFEEVE